MTAKTVAFKKPAKQADNWVETRKKNKASEPQEPAPTKRVTVDIPAELHRRVKMQCAMRGVNMTEVMRDLLDREFPATNTVETLPV